MLAVAGTLMLGCASVGAHRADWNHPSELVGAWVDVAKSTPSDTSLWLMRATGEDGSQHIRATPSPDSSSRVFVATTPTLYGYWYLRGTMTDTSNRQLCYLNHSGRSTGHCIAFVLDTIATTQGPRRRLHLHDYRGLHSTSDRVLVGREQ